MTFIYNGVFLMELQTINTHTVQRSCHTASKHWNHYPWGFTGHGVTFDIYANFTVLNIYERTLAKWAKAKAHFNLPFTLTDNPRVPIPLSAKLHRSHSLSILAIWSIGRRRNWWQVTDKKQQAKICFFEWDEWVLARTNGKGICKVRNILGKLSTIIIFKLWTLC